MKRLACTIIAISVLSFGVGAQSGRPSEPHIVFRSPREFSGLPKQIAMDLEKRRCSVPQSFGNEQMHNVVSGSFRRAGIEDWAILCSRKGRSSILVYWKGSVQNVSSIASYEDNGFLQDAGNGKVGYSRMIRSVGSRFIADRYRSYGGRKPPKITHDGIDDAFVEKASTVHYLYRRKWLQLQGAD